MDPASWVSAPAGEKTHLRPPYTEGFSPQLRPSWFRAHAAALAWATPPHPRQRFFQRA